MKKKSDKQKFVNLEEFVLVFAIVFVFVCLIVVMSIQRQELINHKKIDLFKQRIMDSSNMLLDEVRYDFFMSASSKPKLWTNEQKLQIERVWFGYKAYQNHTQAP